MEKLVYPSLLKGEAYKKGNLHAEKITLRGKSLRKPEK